MATDPNELLVEAATLAENAEKLPGQSTPFDDVVATYVTMTSHIEQCEMHYRGCSDILRQHGQFWTVQEFPKHLRTMPQKRCFDNAFLMARRHGFRYVEGLALGVIPVHHAWCVDDDGLVIDPTWASLNKRVRKSGELPGIGTSYFGIAFHLDIVKEHRIIRDGMMVVSVLSNHANNYSIYRRPLPIDMINSGARKEVMDHGEEKDGKRIGRSARNVSREEPIATDSGVSDRRRTRGTRSRV